MTKKNTKKKTTKKKTARKSCRALCSPIACRSLSTRGDGHPCVSKAGHHGIHEFECMSGAVPRSTPIAETKTETTEPKPKQKRSVSPIVNAINHLEARHYDCQYLGKEMYRVEHNNQRYYFTSEALIVLASLLDSPDAFAEMLQTGVRQTKYSTLLASATPAPDATTNGTSRSSRARTPSRKANRVAVLNDGTLPAWKQKVLERESTQVLIAKLNAATSAQPITESALDAKYERRLAKIAASCGRVQMEKRGDVFVFFGS